MFVHLKQSKYSAWGIGKVEGIVEGMARVSFFDSPTTEPHVIHIPEEFLQQHMLGRQTRVYWEEEAGAGWKVGRVINDDGEDVHVRFPNHDERYIQHADLYVRWDRPIDDPTDYLAHKINETPLFAQARSGFVSCLIEQRAACQGMSGLISSVIDLEPHQVEVIRRVLQDPVQRYLLADEVGLGKTIEAGVLIRQYVLDDPQGHKVVLLLPPALVAQWRDELVCRFLLDAYLDVSVHIVSTTESVKVIRDFIEQAGMLVIDEAHHLSEDRNLYEGLCGVITRVPRLLLLSATPILHNESQFLEMLHLLDPNVFPLEDKEVFRQRIEHRQALAETVAGLVPDNLLQMDLFLDELGEHFPQDRLLQEHVKILRAIVDEFPEESDPQFLVALINLRAHLSETYRLDRRILRNRRSGVPWLTPTRVGVTYFDYSSSATQRLATAIEKWRSHVAADVYGIESTLRGKKVSAFYCELLKITLSVSGRLTECVQDRIAVIRNESEKIGFPDSDELAILTNILTAAEDLKSETNRYAALTDYLQGRVNNNTKFVIFCSQIDVANEVANYLDINYQGAIDRHVYDEDGEALPWLAFLGDPDHQVLVCDARAEEGLNLQGGDKVIVHFDLPLAPNRIEQRIGRVDRYGSGSAIQSIVLRCEDDPFEKAWCACLDQGLGVFHRSIASLQYLIDSEMDCLYETLFTDGLEAVTLLTERLGGERGLVTEEIRHIDEQDALDSLSVPPEESLEEFFEVDSDWRGFGEKVQRWMVDTLQMEKIEGPNVGPLPPGDSVFRFRMMRGEKGQNTLIPISKFLTNFISAIDFNARGISSNNVLTHLYTCRRETALKGKARTHNVRLLRLGESLIEGLNAITALDDRGRSAAMWRYVRGYLAEERADIFMRFDYVVETDIDSAVKYYEKLGSQQASVARIALLRRGDMTFPPFFQSVWLDGGLRMVDDPELLELLQRPYNVHEPDKGYLDKNLNNKRWLDVINLELPVMGNWSVWVEKARNDAEVVLRHHVELEKRSYDSIEQAMTLDEGHFAQLRSRIERSSGYEEEVQMRSLKLEEDVANALYAGIQKPRITLDTITAVFLSGEALVDDKMRETGM